MAGILVGYARTSTCDQQAGLDPQIHDLKSAGCEEIFPEQVSAVAQRDRLKEALRFVLRGDTLASPTGWPGAPQTSCGSCGGGAVVLPVAPETRQLALHHIGTVEWWDRRLRAPDLNLHQGAPSARLCRCPIEESRFLPDRDVTSDGRLSGAKRHHCPWLGASGGVKGQSRLAGARSAALEAATRAQHTSKC
jgi:hypothetical protein